MNLSTRHITTIALCTAVICILAQFSIPLPFTPVPLTGQIIGIFLAGALLGSKKGALAVLAYLLLGTAGLPVFAAARGGIQVLAGPTGGYLIGFVPGTYILGKLVEKKRENASSRLMIGMIACLAFSYLLGGLHLGLVMNFNLTQVLLTGILPYLPLDILKIVITLPLIKGIHRQFKAINLQSGL